MSTVVRVMWLEGVEEDCSTIIMANEMRLSWELQPKAPCHFTDNTTPFDSNCGSSKVIEFPTSLRPNADLQFTTHKVRSYLPKGCSASHL